MWSPWHSWFAQYAPETSNNNYVIMMSLVNYWTLNISLTGLPHSRALLPAHAFDLWLHKNWAFGGERLNDCHLIYHPIPTILGGFTYTFCTFFTARHWENKHATEITLVEVTMEFCSVFLMLYIHCHFGCGPRDNGTVCSSLIQTLYYHLHS